MTSADDRCTLVDDLTYGFTITADAGQATTFITFDDSTMIVSWIDTDAATDTYTIVVSGSVANAHADSPVVNSQTFVLAVVSCATSVETINLALTTEASNKQYRLTDAAAS